MKVVDSNTMAQFATHKISYISKLKKLINRKNWGNFENDCH